MANFEETQEKIVEALEEAWRASLSFEEFRHVGLELYGLKERVIAIRPGDEPGRLELIWGRLVRTVGGSTPLELFFGVLGVIIAVGGAGIFLMAGVSQLLELLKRVGIGDLFVSPALAAAGQIIDPTALLIFQIVIAFMIPLLVIGGFAAVIFSRTPDGRKSGRDILIGVMGFVLGAATRFL